MKVFVVFKGYWMYSSEVYKVFIDKDNAAQCAKEILKDPEAHAYFKVFDIEDFDK